MSLKELYLIVKRSSGQKEIKSNFHSYNERSGNLKGPEELSAGFSLLLVPYS
eukprot:UN09239